MNIKQNLLNTKLFIDNQYLDNYCEIIENNEYTKKQKFKTQVHHIIPRCICLKLNIDSMNDKDNLINLYYKDHLLAHYYLCLCCNDAYLRCKLFIAINFMLGNIKQYNSVTLEKECKAILEALPKYQTLYEESNKIRAILIAKKNLGHSTSVETKLKISLKNKGRIYINKDSIVKSIFPNELNNYLSTGWTKGNPNNNKSRNTHKGDTIVHKGDTQKYISKNDIKQYLADGWVLGRSEEHCKHMSQSINNYYSSLSEEEIQKKCASYGMLGKHPSEETKLKMRVARLGKKHSEKTKQQIGLNKRETIWMTDGKTDVMIKQEREAEFLSKGYHRGRSKNRKQH